MGAVSFSLDPNLVEALQAALPFDRFVETGTYKGDTLQAMQRYFKELVSIELSAALWTDARNRFADTPAVTLLNGDSATVLRGLKPSDMSQGTIYWLDAHWCVADDTAGEISQCPLLGELDAIGSLPDDAAILIDDARLFLSPPAAPHESSQWPDFDEVVTRLRQLNPRHRLIVINDVIAYIPAAAFTSVKNYARAQGVDWLLAMHRSREHAGFLADYEAKERILNTLKKENEGLKDHIANKEVIIEELAHAVRVYRFAFRSVSPIHKLVKLLKRLFKPRLGQLNQYAGIPMRLSPAPKRPVTCRSWPKISIVTPSFRQGDYIGRTLESVLDQNYPNLELFVQDGGSQDETVKVLQQYEDRLLGWESKPDKGQSQAINLGFAHTSGEIMAYLNSDDLLLPHALATVAAYFERHPEVDVVYGDRLLIDSEDLEIGRWIMPGHDHNALVWADFIPQETMFWRRRIWDRAGGQIDESFRFAMDWDLIMRFRAAGAKFAHIPRFLGAFRIHEHQKTSAAITETGFAEMDRIRQRVHGRTVSRAEIRRALYGFMARHVLADLTHRLALKIGSFNR